MVNEQTDTILNRGLLGKQGLTLDLPDYVRTVAAMGVVPFPDGHVLTDPLELTWSLSAFRRELSRINNLDLPKEAPRFIARWKDLVESAWIKRISLPGVKMWADHYAPIEVLEILCHPAAKLTSAWIEWKNSDADLKWRWPFRIGAFACDFDDLELTALASTDSNMWPANKLTQPQEINREHARVEVMVLRSDVRAALTRILTLKHQVRASLIFLVAPQDLAWANVRPYLDALLKETQAGGIVISQPSNEQTLYHQLNRLVRNLSHNLPLDAAMSKAFNGNLKAMIFDRRLLNAIELNQGFLASAAQMQVLQHTTQFELLKSAVDRVDIAWREDQPISDLATELTSRAKAKRIRFDMESEGASTLSEIEIALRNENHRQAVEEEPRYLQGNVFRFVNSEPLAENRGFVLDEFHAVDVFISPEAEGQLQADTEVLLKDVDWGDTNTISLQVLLAEPNQWEQPIRGMLQLPRIGRSSTHRFVFKPTQAGQFQGRLTLFHRGRILQTALLETQVVKLYDELEETSSIQPGITLRVEAELRRSFATLDDRRRFDACIVCNHTATRQAAITAADQDGAYISSLTNLKETIATINYLLTQVGYDADRYRKGLTTKDNAELLGNLAIEGNILYRRIVLDYIDRSTAAKSIRDADYLQIVTMDPESIVPLEFIYDYPIPKENAPVCQYAKEALTNGQCTRNCRPDGGPAEHICPLGFWGLRKVIERHIHVPELEKTAKIIASEPITGRDHLSLGESTLVALSQEVASPGDTNLLATLHRVSNAKVKQVKTWDAWTKAIAEDNPDMLVLLPHAEGNAARITLEIGGDTKQSVYVDTSYVHAESIPPPLTVLLGCDTANTADPKAYLSHVDVFRQADAALVLATIATVFGEHAASMSERLLECVHESIKAKPDRFGEALLRAKQKAVSNSEMIGMCLVAFGDADWKILHK